MRSFSCWQRYKIRISPLSCLHDIRVEEGSCRHGSFKLRPYLLHTLRMGYRQRIDRITGAADDQHIVLESEFGQLSPAEVVYVHPATRFAGDALVTQVKGTILERMATAPRCASSAAGIGRQPGTD